MPTFGLTVLAAATFWSIVYLMLVMFVGEHRNFPGQNVFEFVVNTTLLLVVGWIVAGAAYAATRFTLKANTAFTTCVVTMALFAYVVGSDTYQKVLEPQKRFEKRFDRAICETNSKMTGC